MAKKNNDKSTDPMTNLVNAFQAAAQHRASEQEAEVVAAAEQAETDRIVTILGTALDAVNGVAPTAPPTVSAPSTPTPPVEDDSVQDQLDEANAKITKLEAELAKLNNRPSKTKHKQVVSERDAANQALANANANHAAIDEALVSIGTAMNLEESSDPALVLGAIVEKLEEHGELKLQSPETETPADAEVTEPVVAVEPEVVEEEVSSSVFEDDESAPADDSDNEGSLVLTTSEATAKPVKKPGLLEKLTGNFDSSSVTGNRQ